MDVLSMVAQGITFGTVLSNVFGASGMAILEALTEGRSVLEELPKLVHRSVKAKLPMLSAALEAVVEDIQAIERKIVAHLEPHKAKLDLLQTIPGVSLTSACILLLAEICVDMGCRPTARHLAAGGGVAPAAGRAVERATVPEPERGAPTCAVRWWNARAQP